MESVETSLIKLEWKKREGGGGRTERIFLDFVIDGESLHEQIGGDLVSCLGWFVADQNEKAVCRLLRKEPADFPNNRRSLYVCPECGDLGCGAVSAVIERNDDDKIIWRDFGYQNNYDHEVHFADFANFGPFIFDPTEYYDAISEGLVTKHEQ